MIGTIFIYGVVCLATAFVCTAVKEDEDARLATGTLRLFAFLAGGIAAFGLVVGVLTSLAS